MLSSLLLTSYSICLILVVKFDGFVFLLKTSPLAALIFTVEWLLMNGIWYVISGFNLGWLSIFARGYLIFLWSPWSVEKVIQIPLAFYLARKIIKLKEGINYGRNKKYSYKRFNFTSGY